MLSYISKNDPVIAGIASLIANDSNSQFSILIYLNSGKKDTSFKK